MDREASNLPVAGRIAGTDLERVIQRAAELQMAGGDVPDTLDDGEVIRIAEEVGLEPRHVRQALAELRADAMVPSAPLDRSWPTRLWGGATFQASRVVQGDASDVVRSLSKYLAERESLTCVRDRGNQQVWEPAAGLGSSLQRGLDFSGKKYELAKAKRTSVFVEQLEEGRSLVTIAVDLANERASHAAGWTIGFGMGGLGPTLALILGAGVTPFAMVPLYVGTVTVGARLAARQTFKTQRERTELAVQGILDRLEIGTELASDRPSLRKRIEELFEEDD